MAPLAALRGQEPALVQLPEVAPVPQPARVLRVAALLRGLAVVAWALALVVQVPARLPQVPPEQPVRAARAVQTERLVLLIQAAQQLVPVAVEPLT